MYDVHMRCIPQKQLLDDVNDATVTSWWCKVLTVWCNLLTLYLWYQHTDIYPMHFRCRLITCKYITALLVPRPTIYRNYVILYNNIWDIMTILIHHREINTINHNYITPMQLHYVNVITWLCDYVTVKCTNIVKLHYTNVTTLCYIT